MKDTNILCLRTAWSYYTFRDPVYAGVLIYLKLKLQLKLHLLIQSSASNERYKYSLSENCLILLYCIVLLYTTSTEFNKICKMSLFFCGRSSFRQIMHFWRCLFFINIIIFSSFEAGNCVSNSSFKWWKTDWISDKQFGISRVNY